MPDQFDVVVLGGGTAGLVTASGCARLGRKVALIEREKLGGDCLWTGCVPTKALVASARLAHQLRQADAFGLEAQEPRVTPKAIMESMRAARRAVEPHDDPAKFRKLRIEVISGEARLTTRGKARLVSRSEVEVNGRRLAAKDIVIATGSRTAVPPVEGLAEHGFLDHATFLAQDELPRSLLILGGGAIGIEFAQIFRRFGCEVVVVEMLDDIVNKEDRDVIDAVRRMLTEDGIEIHTGWAAKSVRAEGGKKRVRIENKIGETREIAADEIFVASGRRGNTENLGEVKLNGSYVAADKYLRTSVPRVWACGDVHGGLQFTHVAEREAWKLVRNMLFPGLSPMDYANVPWAIYTDPEIAHVGMTEAEAKAAAGEANVRIYTMPMADADRAIVDRATRGFVKLICDRKGRILGGHLLCANASSLIAPIVLARAKGLRVGDLANLITPYPSLADTLRGAAAQRLAEVGAGWLGGLGRRIAAWSQ
jgi:pyruvate/2-oxoglutarate dehydrogenase complex dihydrolipoamide dehydrogenase (E3) component